MIHGIVGKKIGMTRLFREDGTVVPVTVLEAGPCTVTHIKTHVKDGYEAVQLGYGRAKRLNKPERGHLRDAGGAPYAVLQELRVADLGDAQIGNQVDVSMFEQGETVNVTGTSKGRGFQGGVKRHGFGGGPKTHGQSDRFRAPGSVGGGTFPGRVLKGQKMAGHMGNQQVTVRNLQVASVDPERNLLFLMGGIPGPRDGVVMIRKARAVEGRV